MVYFVYCSVPTLSSHSLLVKSWSHGLLVSLTCGKCCIALDLEVHQCKFLVPKSLLLVKLDAHDICVVLYRIQIDIITTITVDLNHKCKTFAYIMLYGFNLVSFIYGED